MVFFFSGFGFVFVYFLKRHVIYIFTYLAYKGYLFQVIYLKVSKVFQKTKSHQFMITFSPWLSIIKIHVITVTSKFTERPLVWMAWRSNVIYNYGPSENANYRMKLNIFSTMTGITGCIPIISQLIRDTYFWLSATDPSQLIDLINCI